MSNIWSFQNIVVKKEVIEKGINLKKPTELSKCDIILEDFTGSLSLEELNSTLCNDILHGNPFIIGETYSHLDIQIERAICSMSHQEKSLITIEILPENSPAKTISFHITLKNITIHEPIWEWTPEEKYTVALKYKEKGVELFKSERTVNSFLAFSKACKILITLEPLNDHNLDPPLEEKLTKLRVVLYNNMAECQLNKNNFDEVIELCNKVLERDKDNVKALYRRGVAYGSLRDVEKAVDDLKSVLKLQPRNTNARTKFNIYNDQLQKATREYERIVQRMFKNK